MPSFIQKCSSKKHDTEGEKREFFKKNHVTSMNLKLASVSGKLLYFSKCRLIFVILLLKCGQRVSYMLNIRVHLIHTNLAH